MIFREITIEDIPALFDVRTAVRENAFTREGLYSAGITSQPLKTCCAPAIAVGFASVIRKSSDSQWRTGKQRSFGLLPFYPSMKGGGSKLLNLAENWLWEIGWKEIWLSTSLDTGLRAYSFYKKHGWVDAEVQTNQRIMKKSNLPLSQGEEASGQVESWPEKYRSGESNG
jgi:GNAT superfamily N-acetyltransferase